MDTEVTFYLEAQNQPQEETHRPPVAQFSRTEFSNPAFEEGSEMLSQDQLENGNGSHAKLTASGFVQQVEELARWKFKQDCKSPWLCVAVLGALLLALLGGIVVFYPELKSPPPTKPPSWTSPVPMVPSATFAPVGPTSQSAISTAPLSQQGWQGSTMPAPSCGGTLAGLEGSFSSPNYPDPYPPNVLCQWHIQVRAGLVVQLKVELLDLEASDLCFYDRLEIYEEPDARSLWDGNTRYCGHVAPATINTNSNRMQVVFVTDANIAASGFIAKYRAISPKEKNCSRDEFLCDQGLCLLPAFVCDGQQDCQDQKDEANCSTEHRGCGGTLTSLEGQFFSPNYPQPYPHLQICLWHISVPVGHVISLQFYNFSLESQEDCNFDFVEVYDTMGMAATSLMGRFCSSKLPPVLTSSRHVMTVLFVADEEIADSGFFAIYQSHNATEKTCGPLEFLCSDGECVAQELVCDSWRNCPDGSDEFNCISMPSPSVEASCEPIKVEMCQGLSYNSTSFPNIWLTIQHQQGAEELLQDYMIMQDLTCYPHLRLLICSLFVPKCTPDGGTLQPCRPVCLGAEQYCRQSLRRLDVLWPLNCDILPESTNPLECFLP